MKLTPIWVTGIVLAAPLSANAAGYDATADFSTQANPNGVWSYGYSVAGGANYSFVPFSHTDNGLMGPYWDNPALGMFPMISKNQITTSVENIKPGQLFLHPGPVPFQQVAIVRFTAPAAGAYAITGQFFAGAPGAMSGAVYANGQLLQSFGVTTDTSLFSFSSVTLAAGATADFIVGNNGNYHYGATPLAVSISAAVPEPSAPLLLALGVAVLAWRQRGVHRSAPARVAV